jgi:putative sterol carrier protein
MNANDFLEQILEKKVLENPSVLSSSGLVSKSFSLILDNSQWNLIFDQNSNLTLNKQTPFNNATARIEMSEETFEKMLKGKLNIPFAYITRKIKIQGDLDAAIKFGVELKKLIDN